MNTKIMEGLVGASKNMDLMNTPMRVFREAEHRGDTVTMERAMGYVGDFSDKAEEYETKADKGMEEESKEAREKVKLGREEVIRKHKEEREKSEEQIDKNKSVDINTDTVEISEEGKILLKNNANLDNTASDETKTSTVKEPAIR